MSKIMPRKVTNPITITTALTALMFSTGFILASSSVSATSSASATVHVPDACTLVSTLNTPHTATLSPGTSTGYGNSGGVNGIGQTTLKVTCNDSLGFAIYAIGYTEDTFGNTNLVSNTKNNGVSTYTIATGTNTSGANSNWAMQINAVSGSFAPTIQNSFDSSNYHNVPTTYTMVAKRTSATMNPADSSTQNVGSSITTTYAAYISTEQAPDTYTGKVKYTMVHPNNAAAPYAPHEIACTAGNICYQPSANDTVGTMGQESATDGNDVELYASNFSRAGYGFAGWSDAYDYETNPDANFYGPNQTITAPADVSTNGLSLYAVWIKSAGTIQNWDGCSSLAQGATTALTDERDGNVYAVAKLADGKCWTIENLRLDDSAELSSTNTHNPSLPITNVYDATNPTTSNHLSATTDPTTTTWCTSYSSACDDQSMLATNNTTLFTSNTSSSYSASSNVYSYGNYYNWYSATAGHGKYGWSYASGDIVPGDICPAGWHLPTGNTTGEYYALNTALNAGATDSTASNGLRSYPNNFVYSGAVNGSSVGSRSSYGHYWSSSAYNGVFAYILFFNSGNVYPGTDGDSKHGGWAVRCIAGV